MFRGGEPPLCQLPESTNSVPPSVCPSPSWEIGVFEESQTLPGPSVADLAFGQIGAQCAGISESN